MKGLRTIKPHIIISNVKATMHNSRATPAALENLYTTRISQLQETSTLCPHRLFFQQKMRNAGSDDSKIWNLGFARDLRSPSIV